MSGLGERLNGIHARLKAGSRSASLDLFREAEGPLIGYLVRHLGLTREDARDCAVDAIANYLENTNEFDPSKSSLWTYLCMTSTADVRDAQKQSLNRANLLEKHTYEIELWGSQTNNDYDEVERRKDVETILALHGAAIFKNENERRVLELIMGGERSVAAYAKVLGLDATGDVEAEVKRVKDRINLRIKKVVNGLR